MKYNRLIRVIWQHWLLDGTEIFWKETGEDKWQKNSFVSRTYP